MSGYPKVGRKTQKGLSHGIGLRISPMMSLGMPSSVISSPIWLERVLFYCRKCDYCFRRLGCHFYDVIKDHQLTLKTMVQRNINAATTNLRMVVYITSSILPSYINSGIISSILLC